MDNNASKKHSPQKTRNIVAAAKHQFLAYGFQGATMDGIAEEAGVSKQTLYNRYPDKQALFLAILSDLIKDVAEETGDVSVPINTVDELHQALHALSTTMASTIANQEYLSLMRTVLPEFHNYPELKELFRKSMPDRILETLTRIFDEADVRGIIRAKHPEMLARMFAGTILTYVLQRGILGEKDEAVMTGSEAEAFIQQFLEMVRRD